MSVIPTETPVADVPIEDDAPLFAELSRSAGILIIIVAFVGTIASIIDVFVNGWLPAMAHIAWFIGVFLLFSLFLATLVTLVAGHRGGDREPLPLGGS